MAEIWCEIGPGQLVYYPKWPPLAAWPLMTPTQPMRLMLSSWRRCDVTRASEPSPALRPSGRTTRWWLVASPWAPCRQRDRPARSRRSWRWTRRGLQRTTDSLVTRGHSEKLQTQRATGYRHHFFATRVVKMWNSLSATTVNELKSRLRRDWRGHPDLYHYNFTN